MDYEETLAELEQETQCQQKENTVAQYLSEHPEFFLKHPDLLADLHLPHETGKAVSLVEKQVSILRQRQIDTRGQLNQLMSAAKENDKLFALTKDIILKIISATSLDDIDKLLTNDLQKNFGVDEVALVFLSDSLQIKEFSGRKISRQEASDTIGSLLDTKQSIRGIMRPKELSYLFPDSQEPVQSAAIFTLRNETTTIGLLAIGSFDQQRYHNNMGTLFFDIIGETLSVSIAKL